MAHRPREAAREGRTVNNACALIVSLSVLAGCSRTEPPPPGKGTVYVRPAYPTREEAAKLLTAATGKAGGDDADVMIARSASEGQIASSADARTAGTPRTDDKALAPPATPASASSLLADKSVAKRVVALIRDYVAGRVSADIWHGAPAGALYPECVAVGRWDEDFEVGAWCCSGVLIGKNAVLTAAHCFKSKCLDDSRPSGNATDIWVYFGEGGGKEGQNVRVTKFYKYSEVTPAGARHDFAVLVLAADAPVAPAVLHDPCFEPFNSLDRMVIVGFGLTETGSHGTKCVGTVALAYPSCDDNGAKTAYECTTTTEFVASAALGTKPPTKRGDTCQGDSGGPAYSPDPSGKLRLIGLTSRGWVEGSSDVCGQGGIYTRMDQPAYRVWLTKQVPEIRW